jgi:hypothetical protein
LIDELRIEMSFVALILWRVERGHIARKTKGHLFFFFFQIFYKENKRWDFFFSIYRTIREGKESEGKCEVGSGEE